MPHQLRRDDLEEVCARTRTLGVWISVRDSQHTPQPQTHLARAKCRRFAARPRVVLAEASGSRIFFFDHGRALTDLFPEKNWHGVFHPTAAHF